MDLYKLNIFGIQESTPNASRDLFLEFLENTGVGGVGGQEMQFYNPF